MKLCVCSWEYTAGLVSKALSKNTVDRSCDSHDSHGCGQGVHRWSESVAGVVKEIGSDSALINVFDDHLALNSCVAAASLHR